MRNRKNNNNTNNNDNDNDNILTNKINDNNQHETIKHNNKTQQQINYPKQTPSLIYGFILLLSIRVIGSLYCPITDCDEVYNYWEPTHYLLYGYGLQTWEYSPEYGLRSYLYTGLHSLLLWIFRYLLYPIYHAIYNELSEKIFLFYTLRLFFALISSICEYYLSHSISLKYGKKSGIFCILFLSLSVGMFHSTISYLPQTFTMYCIILQLSYWINNQLCKAIIFSVCAVLLGWPFSAVLCIPLGIHVLLHYRKNVIKPIIYGIISSLFCLLPSFIIDYYFYRRFVFAVWNIAVYNSAQQSGEGAALYGVEPASYYLINMLLNFNILVPLALLSLFGTLILFLWNMLKLSGKHRFWNSSSQLLLYMSPAWLWLGIMLSQAHKEERFLFVIYPSVCMISAVLVAKVFESLTKLAQTYHSAIFRLSVIISRIGLWCVLFIGALFSISRVLGLVIYFSAPFHVFQRLSFELDSSSISNNNSSSSTNHVCIGQEWYRFPSHFFIPNVSSRLAFVQSDFSGQLPMPYYEIDQKLSGLQWIEAIHHGTSRSVSEFNDRNEQHPNSVLSNASQCLYFVDFLLDQTSLPANSVSSRCDCTSQVPSLINRFNEYFEVVECCSFLDSQSSSRGARSFWLPQIISSKAVGKPYALMKRTNSTSHVQAS